MRMRTTLLLSLLAVSFGLTALSLIVIHTSLQKQIRQALASDLHRSIATFENLQDQRREMLDREATVARGFTQFESVDDRNAEAGAGKRAHSSRSGCGVLEG